MREVLYVLAWIVPAGAVVGGVDLYLARTLPGYYPVDLLWCYPPAWYLIVSLIPAVWLCWKEE